jgi:serine/threonine-protein kinase RsbW
VVRAAPWFLRKADPGAARSRFTIDENSERNAIFLTLSVRNRPPSDGLPAYGGAVVPDQTNGGGPPVTDVPDSAAPRGHTHDTDIVELSVPTRTAYVSVLRTTAAALAARLDFTLDEIEDLRIAVDEASALLLTQAVPDSQLSCRFELTGNELVVAVSVHSRDPRVPTRNSFSWTVLTALAGQVETLIDPDEQRATITLTKRGEAAPAERATSSGDVRDLDDARHARAREQRGHDATKLPPFESGAVDQ